jgi:hypothetical protein
MEALGCAQFPNAIPELQAKSLMWSSRDQVMNCLLSGGLVRQNKLIKRDKSGDPDMAAVSGVVVAAARCSS